MSEKKNILAALIKAQLNIEAPKKDKTNGNFKYKYASLDSIYHACRIPLFNEGLTVMHDIVEESGKLSLVTTLYHVSGESLTNSFPLSVDKATSQGMASARTYACRYAICNLLALPSDEDDDGELASKSKSEAKPTESVITAQQFKMLDGIIVKYPHLIEILKNALKATGVNHIYEIKQKDYNVIFELLKNSVQGDREKEA